jgi:hypothetical protein
VKTDGISPDDDDDDDDDDIRHSEHQHTHWHISHTQAENAFMDGYCTVHHAFVVLLRST